MVTNHSNLHNNSAKMLKQPYTEAEATAHEGLTNCVRGKSNRARGKQPRENTKATANGCQSYSVMKPKQLGGEAKAITR